MALHERASEAALARFGRKVFVRGVVEISNYCRQDCHYCGMRRDNRRLKRFRTHYEQLARLLIEDRPPSVTDINLQAGEDPVAVREIALPLLQALKRETSLGLSVCLGSLNPNLYAELRQSGARIYIIKFETSNAEHYQALQAPGTLERRLANIRHLAQSGWSVSSGFIAGLPGQTDQDLKSAFALANDLPLSGCSVSPFIPGEETPFSKARMADIDLTLNCMALLRLMRPDWIIPSVSALNIAEPGLGYRRGLRTGANLVTINLTPTQIRGDYLLYRRDRFIMTEERILSAVAAEGLEPSRESLAEHYDISNMDGQNSTTVKEHEEPELAKTK
jgi:biotin synthase